MWGAGQVLQIAANGAPIGCVNLPAPYVGSLCFDSSGALLVSTARARMNDVALLKYPGSGGLFHISLAG